MSKPMINKDMTVSGTSYTLEDIVSKLDNSGGITVIPSQDTLNDNPSAWVPHKINCDLLATNSNQKIFEPKNGEIKILKSGYYSISATVNVDIDYLSLVLLIDDQVDIIIDNGNTTGMVSCTMPSKVYWLNAGAMVSLGWRSGTINTGIRVRCSRTCLTVQTV